MDQRFPASEEREFKCSLQPHFTIPICLGSLMSILQSVMTKFICDDHTKYATAAIRDDKIYLCSFYKDVFMVVVSALAMLIVSLQSHIARWLCPVDLELLVVVQGCVQLTLVSFGGDWYLAGLFGRNPYEVWGSGARASESLLFAMISLVSVVCCLVIPIRSCYSPVLPSYGFCVFCVATSVASSPFPDSLPQLVFMLGCLSAFSVLGGFHKEAHLRKEWMGVQRLHETTVVIDSQDLTIQGQQLEILVLEEGADEAQSRMQELHSSIHSRMDEIRSMEGKIMCLNNEIDELEVEARDHMMPLPGEDPSVSPCTFGNKMKNRQTAGSCENLEGTWVLVGGNVSTSLWLNRLDIQGGNVLLGDGTHARLNTDSNGQFLLEGGVLSFDNHDVLCREGKSGKMLRFKRCQTNQKVFPGGCYTNPLMTEGHDADRQSLDSFDASVSSTLSGRTDTIQDLSEYMDASSAAEAPSRSETGRSSSSSTDQMAPPPLAAHTHGEGVASNIPGQYEEDPLPPGWAAQLGLSEDI